MRFRVGFLAGVVVAVGLVAGHVTFGQAQGAGNERAQTTNKRTESGIPDGWTADKPAADKREAGEKGAEPGAAEPTERQKLLAAVSGEYLGAKSAPLPSVRMKQLFKLASSKDPQIQATAKIALGIHVLYATINKQADFSAEGRLFLKQSIEAALTSDDAPTDALKAAVDAINDPKGAYSKGLARVPAIMDSGDEIQKAQNALRREVKRLAVDANLRSFAATDISVTFSPHKGTGQKLQPSSDGYLVVKNNTQQALPAFTCIVDVRNSDRKVDVAIAEEKKRWDAPSILAEGLGIDPEIQQQNLKNALRYYQRLRLGYGTMVYVPSVRAGGFVKFPFASLGDLDHVVDAVDVLVVSEGVGKHATSLEVDAIRMEIQRIVESQTKQSSRPKQPKQPVRPVRPKAKR